MVLAQCLAYALQLVGRAFTRIFHGKQLHLVLRNGGPVVPHRAQRVQVRAQGYSALPAQVNDELTGHAGRAHHAVDAHLGVALLLLQLLAYPLCHRGRARHLQAHQLKLRSAELFLGRQEIARVRPQGGARHRHHGRSGRSVEATYKLASLPVVGHIFALVGVARWENKGCQMLPLHQLAQFAQSLFNYAHIA